MIVALAAMSLDGRIADAAGEVGWPEAFGPAEDSGLDAFMRGVSAVVIGRRTYAQVLRLGAWPYAGKRVVVLASGDPGPLPEGAEWRRRDVAPLVAELRREAGHVFLVGGTAVFAQFFAADAVDRLDLCVMPVVLGAEPAMFPVPPRRRPRLVEHQTWPNGVVRVACDLV